VIEVLLLSASFMIIILLGIIILVVNFKRWVERRDEFIVNRINQLNKSIDESKAIYKNEITDILKQLKNLLK
jgi:uncharacterized membrane protein